MTYCKLCEKEIESDFYEHIKKEHLTLGAKITFKGVIASKNQKEKMLLKIYVDLVNE